MRIYSIGRLLLLLILITSGVCAAADPASPIALTDFGPNSADEPLAKQFSLDAATKFMDAKSIAWTNTRKCFTCHTNYAYLYARPLVNSDVSEHREVRGALEEMVEKTWITKGPRWDAEVIASAAALAFNDAATTGKLHPLTRAALDRMWTVQNEDGGWTWLKCGWPPMESDDHYGVTLAALAVGFAPDGYAQTDMAKRGLDKMREYFKTTTAPTLHHEAMLLWVSTYHDGFVTDSQKRVTIEKLLSLQKGDGGWGLATLLPWKRADDKEQDLESSDGYGTGFTIYVLRRAGVSASDPRLQKGIDWLKTHQRESGRWFTRSLQKDNKHYISHAGTAFAIMALSECKEATVAAK